MTIPLQRPLNPRAKLAKSCLLVAGLSSPGFAFGTLPIDASGIGCQSADSVPLWTQLSFLRRYAGQLGALPSACPAVGSGSWQSDIGIVVESEIASIRPAQAHCLSETVADWIAVIRAAFSLQIKELAQILKVERPTVYAWMKGEALPQEHNKIRLRQIHRMAIEWNRMSNRPVGKTFHELDAAGRSVVEYLKQSVLPEELILGRFEAIIINESKRAASRKPRLSEVAQEHGIELKGMREQVEEFDVLTGKPLSME